MERRRYIAPTYPVMSKTETTPKRCTESTHYTKQELSSSSSTKTDRLRSEEQQEKSQRNQLLEQCYKEKKKQDELAEPHAVSHNLKLKRPRSMLKEVSLLESYEITTLESNNIENSTLKERKPLLAATNTHRVTSRWKLPMPDLVHRQHDNRVTNNTGVINISNNVLNVNKNNTTCTVSPELEVRKVDNSALTGEKEQNVTVTSEHATPSIDNDKDSNYNSNIDVLHKEDDDNSVDALRNDSINHYKYIAAYCDDPNIRLVLLPQKENVVSTSIVEHTCKKKCEFANDRQIVKQMLERRGEGMHDIDKLTQHKINQSEADKKAVEVAECILLEELRSRASDANDCSIHQRGDKMSVTRRSNNINNSNDGIEGNLLVDDDNDLIYQYKLIKRSLRKFEKNKELHSRNQNNECYACSDDNASDNFTDSNSTILLRLLQVYKAQNALLLEEQRQYIANMELCERNAMLSRATLSSFFDSRYGNQHEWVYRHNNDAAREKSRPLQEQHER